MIEHPRKFTLTIEEEDNIYTHSFVLEDQGTWTAATLKLLDLVNACWGYDVKESIAFISDIGGGYRWDEVGEKTISRGAYEIAKGFDEDRRKAEEVNDWGDDE